jgi:hypothetical protein
MFFCVAWFLLRVVVSSWSCLVSSLSSGYRLCVVASKLNRRGIELLDLPRAQAEGSRPDQFVNLHAVLRAPTIVAVMAGMARVQAIATSPGLWRASRQSPSSARPETAPSRTSAPGTIGRSGANRPSGNDANRSRVIVPVRSPDCIGEYGMTPML